MTKGFFGPNARAFEELDAMEGTVDVYGTSYPVSIGSFLFGYCVNLARELHRRYGYAYEMLTVGGNFVHLYNVVVVDGRKHYIDARGTTSFFSEFAMPFLLGPSCPYEQISGTDPAVRAVIDDQMQFPDDAISDAMLQWLFALQGEAFVVK